MAITEGLAAGTVEFEALVPYDRGDTVAALHEAGEVLKQAHEETGTRLVVRLPAGEVHRFAEVAAGLSA